MRNCSVALGLFTAEETQCSPSHVLTNTMELHPSHLVMKDTEKERSSRTLALKMQTSSVSADEEREMQILGLSQT